MVPVFYAKINTIRGNNMNRRSFIKSIVLCGLAVILTFNSVQAKRNNHTEKVLREQLQNHSLVVIKDNKMVCLDGNGISPILRYLEQGDFEDATVGDKKIGRASALLLVHGKATKVYTPVISKPAIEVFKAFKVDYTADEVVDNILNQTQTDLCPMEKKVQNINSPEEAYEILK